MAISRQKSTGPGLPDLVHHGGPDQAWSGNLKFEFKLLTFTPDTILLPLLVRDPPWGRPGPLRYPCQVAGRYITGDLIRDTGTARVKNRQNVDFNTLTA